MPQDEWEKYIEKAPEASSGDEWEQYVVATEEPPVKAVVEEKPIDSGGLQKATITPADEAAALKQTKGLGTVTTKREVTADVSGNNPSDNGILAVTNPVKTSVKGTTEKQVMIDAADQEIQNQIIAEKVSRDPVYIKGLQKLQANPADPKGHYEVGIGYLNQGGMSGATKAFESAIELNPKDADVMMGAGYVKSHSGDHEGALQDYMSAVSHDPNNPALYNNIAYELNALGRPEEAIGYIKHAILRNPDVGNFYANKSQIEKGLGNDDQAEKDVIKAKEKDLLARDAPTMAEKWESDPNAQQLRTIGDWVDAFEKGEGGMFFLNPLGGYLSRSIDLTTAGIQNINRAADMQAAYLSPTIIDQRNTDIPVLDQSKVKDADKAKKTQQYATSYLKGLQGLSEIAFGATMVTPKVNPYLPSVEGMVPFTVAAEAATIPFPDAVHMAMAPVTAGVNSYYKSKGEPVPEWMSSLSATGDIALVMAAVMGAERLATVGLKAKTDLEKIKEKLAKQEPLTNDEVYQVSSWIRENTDSFASAIAENLAKIPDDVTPAQRVEILPEVIEINGLSKRLEKLKASTNSDKAGLFEELHNKEIQELSVEIQARKKKIYDIIGRADELKGSDAPSGKNDAPVDPSPEPVVNNAPAKVEKPSRPIEEITADVEKSKTEAIPGLFDEIDLLPEGVEKVALVTQLAVNNKERIKNEAEKVVSPTTPAIAASSENKDDKVEIPSVKKTEVAKEEVVEALKDVKSTTKALNEVVSKDSQAFDKIALSNNIYGKRGDNAIKISEAYHKAKQDGSNPELVKVVESALTKDQPTNEKEGLLEGEDNDGEASSSLENPIKTKDGKLPNKHGVYSEEGSEEFILPKKKGVMPAAQINVTELENGKWISRYEINESTSGSAIPLNNQESFNTREEAILAQVDRILLKASEPKTIDWANKIKQTVQQPVSKESLPTEKSEAKKEALINAINDYNTIPNSHGVKKSAALKKINSLASELEVTIGKKPNAPRNKSQIVPIQKSGKQLVRTKSKTDAEGKRLEDRSTETQDLYHRVKNFIVADKENHDVLDVKLDAGLSQTDINKAVKNIDAGKYSSAEVTLLDALDEMAQSKMVRFTQGSGAQVNKTGYSLEEFFGNETQASSEEQLSPEELDAILNMTVNVDEDGAITVDPEEIELLLKNYPNLTAEEYENENQRFAASTEETSDAGNNASGKEQKDEVAQTPKGRTREQLLQELESAKEELATAESSYQKAKKALDKNLQDKQSNLFNGGNEQKLFDDTAEIKAQAESAKKKFDAAKEKADNLQKLVNENPEGQQEINEINEAKSKYGQKEITVEGEAVSYQSAFNFGDDTGTTNLQRKEDSPASDSNKLKPGEFQTVEAVWSKDRNLQFSGTLKVESHKDVAHIMRLLETAAVEHAFAIHIDKDGNSHIQFLSIGGVSGTVVDPKLVLSGVENFKSKKVYLIHNHPSGALNPSEGDMRVSRDVFAALKDISVEAEHVIMDTFTGEYTLIENDLSVLQYSRDQPKIEDKPLEVHKLDMLKVLSKESRGQITSSHSAAFVIQGLQYSALPKKAMLVMSRSNKVLANIILDDFSFENIIKAFSKIQTATGILLYGNTEIVSKEAVALQKKLTPLAISLLDVMKFSPSADISKQYKSAADEGLLNEVQAKYGTGEVNDSGIEKGSGHYDDSIPSKPSADGKLNPIDLPELIQIAKEISGGKIPGIKTLVKSLGYFNSKLKEIMLSRDLFDAKNYDDLLKVIAHELGHFIDFIPDETLKRGNILGRIASLKDFMGKYLPFKPGDPGELTKEDIKRIRAEVKKAQQPITKEIDEEITKTIGITPQDVLDVWNSTVAGHNNPQLLDFIKTLSDADKKSIVKDAIKGVLPDMLKHLQTIVKEKTGKKIIITEYPDLAKAIRDAIIDEVKKRKLWVDSEIYNEAYNLSKEWRPFDENNTTPSFLKYRKSGKEVYADMISILFNSPGHLEAKAPKFFEAFTNYLDAKPEFKAVYEDMLDLMTDEARLQQERLSNTKSNYEAAREKRREIQQKEKARRSAKKVWDSFQQQFISISSAVLKKLPNDKTGARLSTKERVRNSIEQMFMWKSKTALLMDEYKKVTDKLVDNGIAIDDVGAIVESIRNLSPTRADKANPLGFQLEEHNLDRVQKVLDEYSVEQQELIGKALIDFYEINFNVMQDAYDAGLISADMWQEVQKNKYNYATFKPIKYIDEKIQTAKIFAVTGTLEGIANPFEETMVKTAFIQRAAERNKAIIETLEALEKHSPGTIVKTEYDNGKPKGALKPGEKYVHYRRGGKAAVFITDADIANIFEFVEPQELSLLVKALNTLSAPLKAAFTKYNPGFVFYNNLIKDGRRSLSNVISILSASNELKSLNYISLFLEYPKAFFTSVKDAKSVLNKTPTGIAKRMLLHGAINPESAIFSDHNPELSSMANIFSHHENLQEHLGLAQKKQSIWEMAKEALLFDLETFIAQPGRILELTNKIAGYKILEKRLGAEAAAYYTRNVVGTPNYSEKTGADVSFIPFAKVIMQGLRNDVDLMTGKKTAKSYWLFKGLTVLIPALLTLAASKGLFDSEDDEEGQKLSDWFAKLSKYQRLNTGNIPLGFTDDGKARGLTIPMDDISKLQYALIMELFEEEDAKDKARTMFQQVVQSTPLPNFANGYSLYQHWYTFLVEGQNPYDNFYKKDIISNRNFDLGGTAALSDMGKHTLNTFGLRLPDKEMGEKTTTKEKLLSLPLINRIYKETSSGDYEYLRQTKKEVKKENAQRLQSLDDTIEQILETEVDGAISDKKYNPSTVHTLANKAFEQYKKEHPQAEKKDREYIISKMKLLSQRQLVKHLPVANAILGAESKAEKKAIMEEFKSRVSKQDYIDLLRVLDNADIRPE